MCLRIANVSIKGLFDKLVTQAMVSPQLLFSNRTNQPTNQPLREESFVFQALLRNHSTDLAAKGANKYSNAPSERNGVTGRDSEDSALSEAHDRGHHKSTRCGNVSASG